MVKVLTVKVEGDQTIRRCPMKDCGVQVFYPQRYCHNCGEKLDWKGTEVNDSDNWWRMK